MVIKAIVLLKNKNKKNTEHHLTSFLGELLDLILFCYLLTVALHKPTFLIP